MNIITISREFGSGGREVGKRLADALEYAYYDREILTALAEDTRMDPDYLEQVLEQSSLASIYPVTFGRTFTFHTNHASDLLARQARLIRMLATKGNCVLVGRNANVILDEFQPLRIFVYADMEAKIHRCRERETNGLPHSDQEYEKQIRQINKQRAKTRALLCPYPWDNVRGYDLCINTSRVSIKKMIPSICAYAKTWFEQ